MTAEVIPDEAGTQAANHNAFTVKSHTEIFEGIMQVLIMVGLQVLEGATGTSMTVAPVQLSQEVDAKRFFPRGGAGHARSLDGMVQGGNSQNG